MFIDSELSVVQCLVLVGLCKETRLQVVCAWSDDDGHAALLDRRAVLLIQRRRGGTLPSELDATPQRAGWLDEGLTVLQRTLLISVSSAGASAVLPWMACRTNKAWNSSLLRTTPANTFVRLSNSRRVRSISNSIDH